MLTESEIHHYEQYGYVIPEGFRLQKREVSDLRLAVNRVLEDYPKIFPDRMINTHLYEGALTASASKKL